MSQCVGECGEHGVPVVGGVAASNAVPTRVDDAIECRAEEIADAVEPQMTEDEWVEAHRDQDDEYDSDREVIVKWRDRAETPSQCIARLNSEVLEYAGKYGQAREDLAEAQRKLAEIRATLES